MRINRMLVKTVKIHFNSNIHPSFSHTRRASYIQKITDEIKQNFAQCITVYRLNKERDEHIVDKALKKVQAVYRREMDKHVSASSFLKTKKLRKCHRTAKTVALESCKLMLTRSQSKDLTERMNILFISYREDNLKNVPTTPAIGIDLGTTNFWVSVYMNGKVEVCPNPASGTHTHQTTMPSFVAFCDGYVGLLGRRPRTTPTLSPRILSTT
jgi:hypothetical protein